ncbi:pentapeptide repeat-containing protein [Pasteurella multocida]|uniref:pentapeptide repeat-containing protein n=1 Tax=Pasteurella multocida TaxID=747 RepID=UPI002B6EE5B5|nr:pentapeptide repeat-containing protein [Pasteurella multocida]MEB3467695.1 pentapeptide repeat-containing protein [Pasteurella multocida]MEB3499893.1 pentapeptide repeat-containing protein [Pasteurella multocida]
MKKKNKKLNMYAYKFIRKLKMINWKCLIKAAFIEKFKEYKANLFSKPNEEQVFIIGLSSFVFAIIVITLFIWLLPENLEGINGIWTLITAVISSPILYAIWRLRDQNATKQIENQRKDINLKEFQKIAEWVSGLHLIEDEVTEKIVNQTEQETTRKYTQQSENLSIPTFRKKDGAVGLQIAAIYNLLPFYRGEHGESFKKPAFNLLKSAWLSMQYKQLSHLNNGGEITEAISLIRINGSTPLGMAITQVMLCDGGSHFFDNHEQFPGICLAGMNFHMHGIEIDLLKENFMKNARNNKLNFRGANLQGATLREFDLSSADFTFADISGADLGETILSKAVLSSAICSNTSFVRAKLAGYLHRYDLDFNTLSTANLYGGHFFKNIFSEEEANTLKSRGAILCEEGHDIVIAKHTIKKNVVEIESPVDFIKTQQENPDWEISIIK